VFVDAHDLNTTAGSRDWDVIIVGAGVAGLSLAQGLADSKMHVLLLESGGMEARGDAAELLRGTSNRADYPLVTSRARAFGGTSTLWSGACIPLDPVDFSQRSWIPHSGWPISDDELRPHYPRAARVFGHANWTPATARLEAPPPLAGGDLAARPVFTSTPLDVGRSMRDWIAKSRTVTCGLGANVTGLSSGETGKTINGVTFRDQGGKAHEISARAVVLATGGIEAPRLLLAADRDAPSGIGDVRHCTGRGYMDHPVLSLGILPVGAHMRHFLPFTNGWRDHGVHTIGTIGLKPEARARHGLLDLHLRCFRLSHLEEAPEIVAWKRAAEQAGAMRGLGEMLASHGLRSAPTAARYGLWHLWNKTSERARFGYVRFLAFAEQEPEFDNRITLGREVDRHGIALPHLHLTESARFRDSVARSCAVLTEGFAANGLPGARMGEERVPHLAHYRGHGLHHMGATRMSEDARTGTVDRDCRVHGTSNLYVAGSSVFPTGGAANPTFTISALAFRLADHLRQGLLSHGA
jgi:choline dehydrogenase-like flavoprotein